MRYDKLYFIRINKSLFNPISQNHRFMGWPSLSFQFILFSSFSRNNLLNLRRFSLLFSLCERKRCVVTSSCVMDDVVEDSVGEIVGISSKMVLDSEHFNLIVKSTIVTWMKSRSLMLMLDQGLNAADTCACELGTGNCQALAPNP